MIFSQKDPAEWFKHQRFRKWETKTKIMALEFALDLFVEPGSTWKAVCICICLCICFCICFPICFCYCICLCVCLFTGQVMFYLLITWIKCLKGHKFQRLLLGYPNCHNYQMPHLSICYNGHIKVHMYGRETDI